MIQSSLLKRLALLLSAIAFFNFLGKVLYFHWTIWWYDVGLHFFSGGALAMAFILAWFFLFSNTTKSKKELIVYSFFFVIVVGIIWEIFELNVGFTSFSDGIYYVRDTVSDIIVDVCGGFFSALYSFKFFPQISGKINKNA